MEDYKGHVIYQIISKLNNKKYIGSAVCYKIRKKTHLFQLKNNKHCNIKLQNHVNKYGIDDLYFVIIEKVENKENLIIREQHYIDSISPYFNICLKAGSSLGRKKPIEKIIQEEEIKKQIEHNKKTHKVIFDLIDSISW